MAKLELEPKFLLIYYITVTQSPPHQHYILTVQLQSDGWAHRNCKYGKENNLGNLTKITLTTY